MPLPGISMLHKPAMIKILKQLPSSMVLAALYRLKRKHGGWYPKNDCQRFSSLRCLWAGERNLLSRGGRYNEQNLNTAFDNSVLPTITTYDILDRVTKTYLPDDTETNFAYSIMNGLLKTTVIDEKNNKQETFANGSGLTVRTTQYASASEPINTYFAYNPIN